MFSRRKFLQSAALLTATAGLPASILLAESEAANKAKRKKIFTVAHITDVHLPAEPKVHERYKQCLENVKKHKIDFILNGGDSVMDVSYDKVTRESVAAQWA